MPPIVVPNAAQVRLLWSVQGNLGVNVLGTVVQGATVIDQTLANSLGAAIKSAFTTNLATHYGPGTNLARVGVRDIRSANLAEFRDTGAAAPGAGTGDALPRQVAFCLTLRTARAGKSFRGRFYLPPPIETVSDANGDASTAYQTAALAFADAINDALIGNGLQWAVVSRPETARTVTKTYAARAGQTTPVIAIESRNINFETQRRRNNAQGGVPPGLLGSSQLVALQQPASGTASPLA